MEEKKLTDEEVIEVLKNCGAGIHSSNRECRNCVLEDDGRCVNNLRKYSLDLIHRLQEENAGLKEQVDKYFTKACLYYAICKGYGIDNFYDDELEPKPAKEGKTITFPKFKGKDEVE